MATTLEVSVYRPLSEARMAADDLQAVHAEAIKIDALMSLYRPDSELVALNARSGAAVPVSAEMFEVLAAAAHYARLSDGAFDVTAQPLVDLWGFYRQDRTSTPTQAEIDALLPRVGHDRVALDARGAAVTLEPGTHLDLGGIAKGYAVDLAIGALRKRGVTAALVNLGGNIGVLGQRPDGKPWTVGIQHPRDNRLMGTIRFKRGAVATSGDYDRYFESGGKRYGHILDPRTGWPVDGIASVTVVAPNATAADALSTAAFVLGPEHGIALLNRCLGVAGVAVAPTTEREPRLAVIMSAALAEATIELAADPTVIVQPSSPRTRGDRRDCAKPISNGP
jgi:thiamine biosynthesis lipoprotein